MTQKSGAFLVRYALEQLPVSWTFGIPGVHNTEIYDQLAASEKIKPILVTHETGAAFIADAVSRTSNGEIGVLVIVPAAGMTHAMSGIGEAFLDGIPLLVISGGTRTDINESFQLHELDQGRILAGITKGYWRVTEHQKVVPTLWEAYRVAVSGTPGPVFVEIPVNIQLFQGPVGDIPKFEPVVPRMISPEGDLDDAVALLSRARSPGIFVGWGAVDVVDETKEIADLLGAPVSTTLQGLSAFPGNHPLHAGMGFSRAAVPAAEHAFQGCDCLLAIGTRFGEIPTGSFGATVPENLIHVDIDPGVFNRNYKAKITIEGDSCVVIPKLLSRLKGAIAQDAFQARRGRVALQLAEDKAAYKREWLVRSKDRVNPILVFDAIRKRLPDDAILVADDGNHTFLAAELFEVRAKRSFISPTDFNCMGYCVPAAIGAKLSNPRKQVVGIVGDGAFLMTGMEILTAATHKLGIVYFVFSDGELAQISQGQEIPYHRKTCTILGKLRLEGIAMATGAKYIEIANDQQVEPGVDMALQSAAVGQPVIVDVRIDYAKRTRFTQGVVQTVLKRFPMGDRVRFISRALVRKVTG